MPSWAPEVGTANPLSECNTMADEDNDMHSQFRPIFVRLLKDSRFVKLGDSEPLAERLLMRLYLACDRQGRGNADPAVVKAACSLLTPTEAEVAAALVVLSTGPRPLVHVYPDAINGGSAYEIDQYWQDLTEDMRRKAGQPHYPPRPIPPDTNPAIWPSDLGEVPPLNPEVFRRNYDAEFVPHDAARAPQGRPKGAQTAPRDETRQDPLRGDEDKTRDRARAHHEPDVTEAWNTVQPATSDAWPSLAHELAGKRWLGALYKHSKPFDSRANIGAESIANVARNEARDALAAGRPDGFVAAADAMAAEGATCPGWGTRYPLRWLAKECEIASRKVAKPAPTPRPPQPKPGQFRHVRREDVE